jgi:hypothetical protein
MTAKFETIRRQYVQEFIRVVAQPEMTAKRIMTTCSLNAASY